MSATILLHPLLVSKPALASEIARRCDGEWIPEGHRCVLKPNPIDTARIFEFSARCEDALDYIATLVRPDGPSAA